MSTPKAPYSICAVSYLNTVPLIWGMQHGPQQAEVELSFEIPSACAETVAKGGAQVGLAPVAEIARQQLEVVPGYGIACHGAVRSILLISQKPIREIKSLAADSSSRTSVELARVVLREVYGAEPEFFVRPPALDSMLAECDAALLIGDPALRIDPYSLKYDVLDLGAEWYTLTGLPMVFALWAAARSVANREHLREVLRGSYEFGHAHTGAIADSEWQARGITRSLAHEYLTRYIHYEIGDRECRGLEAFLELAGLPQVSAALAETR
ncbi:MAG: menaquinone biosynthesis protein [Bryobacteraceae bacterium]